MDYLKEVNKAELRDWLRDPVAQAVFRQLEQDLPTAGWRTARDLVDLARLQGRQEVMDWLARLSSS